MKLIYNFEKVELDGEIMCIPVGENEQKLSSILKVNKTAAFIMDLLVDDIDEGYIVEQILDKYNGDKADIEKYVHSFVVKLLDAGILA